MNANIPSFPSRIPSHVQALFEKLQADRPQLEKLLEDTRNYSGMRKFYTESFKAVRMSGETARIVAALRAVSPHRRMNPVFEEILRDGIVPEERVEGDPCVLVKEKGRAIAEANLHARFVLEACVRSARELEEGGLAECGADFWMLVTEVFLEF